MSKDTIPRQGEGRLTIEDGVSSIVAYQTLWGSEKLETVGYMKELNRTKVDNFKIQDSYTLEELEQLVSENKTDTVITSVETALISYPEIIVTAPQANRFHNGGALDYARLHGDYPIGIYRVYSPERKLLGLGEIKEDKSDLNVRRVLIDE